MPTNLARVRDASRRVLGADARVYARQRQLLQSFADLAALVGVCVCDDQAGAEAAGERLLRSVGLGGPLEGWDVKAKLMEFLTHCLSELVEGSRADP